MALATACQTPGARFSIRIADTRLEVTVELPRPLNVDEHQAQQLEANVHNAIELVLAPFFVAP